MAFLGVSCNETEWGHIEEDSSKPSYSEQEALTFALDAFGRRKINVETWEAYKCKNGWLLRDSKNRDSGFVPIRDRWTVRVLEKGFPTAVLLHKPADQPIDLHFTPDQQEILAALLQPGDHSRNGLATAIDTTDEGAGVEESRITRAMNGLPGKKHLGLIFRGFITHGKASGYALTPLGRQIALKLSS